jgi:hypothetical protein
MNCSQSQDLLQRRLDGEPIADRTALDAHLAQCLECRGLHAAAGRLKDGLRLLRVPAPPVALNSNIVAVALEERRSRVLKQRLWMAGAALAAGLLVAVVLDLSKGRPLNELLLALGWIKAEPMQSLPPPDPEPLAVLPREMPAVPSLRDSVAEASSAVVALTRQTVDQTREQSRIITDALPMTTPLPGLEAAPPALDPPVQSVLQDAGQKVSLGFEPVTSSARRAFSMFVREVPAPPVN